MRQVTEADFRAPEFRDAKTEDYEFREDGKIVRKDRWERGLMSIRHMVILGRREFEIPEVVEAVRKLAADNEWYHDFKEMEPGTYDLLLDDPTVSASPGIHAEVSERRGLMIQGTSLPIDGEDVDGSFELRSLQSHGSVRKLTTPCSTVNLLK